MSLANPFDRVLRAGEGAAFRHIERIAHQVSSHEDHYRAFSDDDLRRETSVFRQRIARGESSSDLLPESFAVVREASRRVLGKRHFDVQVMGGIALHFGAVAEMRTGEGKAVTTTTSVPTTRGPVCAGDLCVGDEVFGPDGLPTTISGVYPQGVQRIWLLETVDGRIIECNAEHLWGVFVDDAPLSTATTERIGSWLAQGKKVDIPLTEPLEYPDVSLDANVLYRLGFDASQSHVPTRIPPHLLRASIAQRRELLIGFVDGAGDFIRIHRDESFVVRIKARNTSVHRDVLALARSLGYRAHMRSHDVVIYPRGTTDLMRLTRNPSLGRLAETIAAFEPDTGNQRLGVARVVSSNAAAEQVCFTVTHPSHLFVVGDHIVTHNTLVATLPSYLNALSGQSVHVVTVNDYLATEQSEQMSRIHHFLGMSVGCITSGMDAVQRQAEYAKDITYGTNNEFGFDYLRDNAQLDPGRIVQRGHGFAIIDEIDSILIDEARTPLIISKTQDAKDPALHYYKVARDAVKYLERGELDLRSKRALGGDFVIDEKKRTATLTDRGIERVEDLTGITNLYDPDHAFFVGYVENALNAQELYQRDKDYIVEPSFDLRSGTVAPQVKIIDEHTGRILEGRRYNEGLHQSLESKEGLSPKPLSITTATITLQNYFRLYDTLSGMTGTGMSEAAEFYSVYRLPVYPIPTNRPPQRIDHHDRVFATEQFKFDAVVRDVVEIHATGQPILIGTTSVEKSEYLSGLLDKAGVPHAVLNAKHHEHESDLVAQAGRKGAVTVSTNMAGRGTDIILGGNAEHMVIEALRKRGISAETDPETYEREWAKLLPVMEKRVAAEHDEVVDLGGLFVIATERHESRRIDDQLRGRAGRQGDPGASRFYLSLTDDLMKRFNPSLMNRVIGSNPSPAPMESKMMSRAIESAQHQAESVNKEIRKNVLKYDDVLTSQRNVIYRERHQVLVGESAINMYAWIREAVTALVDRYALSNLAEQWDWSAMWNELAMLYPLARPASEIMEDYGGVTGLTRHDLITELVSDALYAYDDMVAQMGENTVDQMTRSIALIVTDTLWPLQIEAMEALREGVSLRTLAQKDPLVEYQREGAELFKQLIEDIHLETVRAFFGGPDVVTKNEMSGLLVYTAPDETGSPIVDHTEKMPPVQPVDPAPMRPEVSSIRTLPTVERNRVRRALSSHHEGIENNAKDTHG